MKKIIFIFISILFINCESSSGQLGTDQTEIDNEWQLVWSDEFDVDGLPDNEKWDYDTGDHGWGNNERQNYTAKDIETAEVKNGMLHIRSFLIDRPNFKEYRSARMVTRNKAAWKYGRFEIRAKLPSGTGVWPAIWMLPEEWNYGDGGWPDNGEIDIMEYVGFEPGVVHSTIHTKARNHILRTEVGEQIELENPEKNFHVYALEWFPDKLKAYVDNELYFTYENDGDGWETWPFDKEFHLILNTAIGGSWGGKEGVDDTIFPQEFVIDYVRVYQ